LLLLHLTPFSPGPAVYEDRFQFETIIALVSPAVPLS